MRLFHLTFWSLLLTVFSYFSPLMAADARPNFMLIIADDLCWRDLGFAGNKEVLTPRLDRLRAEGMWLKQMYTPATTCSPSRHALYTGLFPIRSGAFPNHTRVYDQTKSMFTHFKEHGYRVALQGKEHVGPKPSFPYEHLMLDEDKQFASTSEFVKRKSDQPWLLVFASHDPHGPWNRGPKKMFDPAKLTIPPYLHDNTETRNQLADYYAEITALDNQVGRLMDILQETKQEQNTLVLFVSEQGSSFPYGGKWSVYDNGIKTSSLARWPGKVSPGSTSDALMQYVDVPATFLDAAGINPDSIDTGCPDANGNKKMDGKSFLKVLTGEQQKFRDYIYAQHTTVGINGFQEPYPMRAVRDSQYKYIRNLTPQNTYNIGGIHKGEPITSWQKDAEKNPQLKSRVDWLFHRPAEELYDIKADQYEFQNLADKPELQEVKARLSKEMDDWMKQQGDEGLATEMKAPSRQGKGKEDDEEQPAKPKPKRKKQQETNTN